jgi:histidine decarboxylase
MRPDGSYVAAPLLAFGLSPRLASASLSRTVAFDRAEGAGPNVTQTNMVRVSSFNGPGGLLLGYDLLPGELAPSGLAPGRREAYDAAPLFAATRALFGTVAEPRFPIAPGAHLLCAYKECFLEGPGTLYAAFAIGLPQDRERDADLFMEDVGALDPAPDVEGQHRGLADALLDSAALVGENLGVRYERVLVAVEAFDVPEGHVGCALAAAPYVQLAQGVVPEEGAESLVRLSPREWEQRVAPRFLCNEGRELAHAASCGRR